VIEGGVISFVRADHIGRPVFATNATGVKTWTATYTPFGGVHTSTGAPPSARFPGQWFQSESGLHQNWMRDYDPTTGRYLQADPLGLIDGASVYGYVRQSPMMLTDPTGECPWCVAAAVGAAANVAFGFIYKTWWLEECYTWEDFWWDAGVGAAGGVAFKGFGAAYQAVKAANKAKKAAKGAAAARAAAKAAAAEAAAAGAKRGAAAAVASESGKVYTGLSKHAAFQAGQKSRPLNEALEQIANGCGGNGSRCAEAAAISKMIAAEGIAALEGAFVAAARIGGGNTGNLINPCRSCGSWLSILGVGF
jgi:RHS repeat-associated protein